MSTRASAYRSTPGQGLWKTLLASTEAGLAALPQTLHIVFSVRDVEDGEPLEMYDSVEVEALALGEHRCALRVRRADPEADEAEDSDSP